MRGERFPDDETAPVHGSVCAACCDRLCRSGPTGGGRCGPTGGGRCGYSDEEAQEAGDDDRIRCKGAEDSREAPISQCLTLRVPYCCYEGSIVCFHLNLDDLAFYDQ